MIRSYSRRDQWRRWSIVGIILCTIAATVGPARRQFHEWKAQRAIDSQEWAKAWQHCSVVDELGGAMISSDHPEFWRTAVGMVRIPAGEFQMGDPMWEMPNRRDERSHQVDMPRELLVSRTEVTQALWTRVMDSNPSRFRGHDLPVDSVTWDMAVSFCNQISEKAGLQPPYTGSGDKTSWNREADGFRIPTETEWEYFARAGTSTQFSTGDSLSTSHANFDPVYDAPPQGGRKALPVQSTLYLGRTTPAGFLKPNPWGLHDVHGNLWEWCWDHYGPYPGSDYGDLPLGSGPDGDYGGAAPPPKARIVRGGAWGYGSYYNRSAFRGRFVPNYRYTIRADQVGLRIVRETPKA